VSSAPTDPAYALRAAILEIIDRVPVAELPVDGTHTLVDNGSATSPGTRRALAKFSGRRWVRPDKSPLPFEPTFWMRLKGTPELNLPAARRADK